MRIYLWFRLARMRFRNGMKLPYRWQDADLDKSMRILRKLKKELVAKLYGKGVPAPSKLAQKLMNTWEKSEDSLSDKLDAVQFLMEYVGRSLELVPKNQLPVTESFVTCALAQKLENLPEWFAEALRQRLNKCLPASVYAQVMDGKAGDDIEKMQAMLSPLRILLPLRLTRSDTRRVMRRFS